MAPYLDYFSHELWLLKHSMALLFVRQLHRKPLPQLSYPLKRKVDSDDSRMIQIRPSLKTFGDFSFQTSRWNQMSDLNRLPVRGY